MRRIKPVEHVSDSYKTTTKTRNKPPKLGIALSKKGLNSVQVKWEKNNEKIRGKKNEFTAQNYADPTMCERERHMFYKAATNDGRHN